MGTAKNRVLRQIDNLPTNAAIGTSELADELDLSRSVVSHYLNQLVKDGKVKKIDERPVKWTKVSEKVTKNPPEFDDVIGNHVTAASMGQ